MVNQNLPALRFAIGDTYRERGARKRAFDYELVEIAPHQTRSGAASFVLTWRGRCVLCGADFTQKTGRRPRQMLRTCSRHRGTAPRRWPAEERHG